MAILKGWEHVLIMRGNHTKEVLTDSATGAEETWYAAMWPITDSGYTVTDDEADVTLRNETDSSDVGTGDFVLDGSEGTVVHTGTGAKQYVLTYYDSWTIGSYKGMSWDHNNNTKENYVCGQRNVYEITEHQISISGSIDLLYIDQRAYTILTGANPDSDLNTYTLIFQTKSSGGQQFEFAGIKFDKGDFTTKADDILASNVTFKATGITVTST